MSLRFFKSALALMMVSYLCPMQAETIQNQSIWLTYGVQYTMEPNWRLSFQAQPYWRDQGHTYDQVTYRPGLHYIYNPHWIIAAGYAYAISYPQNQSAIHENRWWGDFTWQDTPLDRLKLAVRTRLEHRDIEHQSNTLYALREQIRASLNIQPDWQFIVNNECYYTLNETRTIDQGFDQNRFFIGFSKALGKHHNVEFGLLDQYAKRSVHDTNNTVLSLTINQQF